MMEKAVDDVPDQWMDIVNEAQLVLGFENGTTDFSEPVLKPVVENIYPLFIIQYGILAIIGIISNLTIIFYIMNLKLYRDVTHSFIVNLSFCQFVQCSIVLPITLMVLLIQNWIFGQFLCFFLPLLQDIPLHVAMITHLLIAWDRMRWLADPLKGRMPSFVCSCATWLAGMVIALPYPIYTTYLDLGLYVKKFRGVGICAVNLMDDMHEYMRGLFVIMYLAPMITLGYLYIRTSRELRPPDGPYAVMLRMFEARAEARNRHRNSSLASAASVPSCSYDLYDAEVDITREKRTQRYLCGMAATQAICVCPLMILRLARMELEETYENAAHFDVTYLMFVWIAFLPTVIVPLVYASWILPRSAKERLRGYLRLSYRRQTTTLSKANGTDHSSTDCLDKNSELNSSQVLNINPHSHNRNRELKVSAGTHRLTTLKSSAPRNDSIGTTSTVARGSITSSVHHAHARLEKLPSNGPINKKQYAQNDTKTKLKLKSLSADNTPIPVATTKSKLRTISDSRKSHHADEEDEYFRNLKLASDLSLNNSCSNITSSTYCNNGSQRDINYDSGGSLLAGSTIASVSGDVLTRGSSYNRSSKRHRQQLSNAIHNKNLYDMRTTDSEISSTHIGSTSTLERDLEIIDLLERERSMDIQDMMEQERIAELGLLERRRSNNSSLTYHRSLSTANKEYDILNEYPPPISSRKNSSQSSRRDSGVCKSEVSYEAVLPVQPEIPDNRIQRTLSTNTRPKSINGSSTRNSIKRERERHFNNRDYRDNNYAK